MIGERNMIDMKFIRENTEIIRKSLKDRNSNFDLDGLLKADEARRELLQEAEILKKEKNDQSALIGKYKREGKNADELLENMGKVSDKIKELDEKTATIEYVEMSNTWVDKIIPKMEQLKKDFYEEFPELDLKLEAGNIAIRTFLMANEGLRSMISTIRDNFIGKVKEVDSYALNREISENSYVYSDIFKQIEDEADIDILNKKLNALEIVNRIQSDDKIIKLVNDLSEEILEGISNEEN